MENTITYTNIGVKILLINGSPRPKSNTAALLEQVKEGVLSVPGTEILNFSFQNAHFGEPGYEGKKNALDDLAALWRAADGIVFAAPIYTAGPPGLTYTAWDQLEDVLAEDLRRGGYAKAGGVLIQGSAPWGLEELGAQDIMEKYIALHVIPAARLVGRVVDKEPPTKELLSEARSFGARLAEHTKFIALACAQPPKPGARILLLNAGVHLPDVGDRIAARVEKVLAEKGVRVVRHDFTGKKLEGCHHCIAYCGSHQECLYKDDFQEFLGKWLSADGYLTVASANTLGPPAVVRRALDRLSEHVFQTALHEHLTNGTPPFAYPRYSRPTAVVAYGDRRYGGQTETFRALIAHDIHRGNYPMGGRDHHSPLGAAGFLIQASQLGCDQYFTDAIDSLAQDVAELANRIRTAKHVYYDTVPREFYASRKKMGVIDKEVYQHGF
jgi:multimeric flavodoxin WrbA